MSEREREREFSWLNFLVKSYVYFDGFQVCFFGKFKGDKKNYRFRSMIFYSMEESF